MAAAKPVGSRGRARWSSQGCSTGEVLSRKMTLPRRATLLARDGSVLGEGAATEAGQRASPLGAVAARALGEVGPVPAPRARSWKPKGFPRTRSSA